MNREIRKLYLLAIGIICFLVLVGCTFDEKVKEKPIDEVCALELGGVNQWIRITGSNIENPI